MQNIRKILIPVDFEKPSKEAAMYAGSLASKKNAELLLLNVIDTPGLLAGYFADGDELVRLTDKVKEKLFQLSGKIRDAFPGVKVKTRVERGKPYTKILDLAKESGVCRIILGENHQYGNPDDELGTTVYHVTLKSNVPVLTLKGDLSRMNEKIVVPLDLTKKTREQLSAALFYGLDSGAKVYLVSALVGGILAKDSRIYKKLEEAKKSLEMNGVPCEMKLFQRSEVPPFKRVLEYSEDIGAGMILLMTHQEGYTHDNYIGAFAHHIMNLSRISVLSITNFSNNLDFSPFFKTLVDPLGVFSKIKI